VSTINAAIGADPRREEYWCEKGRFLLDLGNPSHAMRFLDEALTLNPEYRPAWRAKGQALEALARPEEAQRCFERANSRPG